MPRKLDHAAVVAWLLGICFILLGIPTFAESPGGEEVLGVLGMDNGQIAELEQGQPVAYALSERSADELAVGVVWYLPVPLDKVVGQLRLDNPDLLDVDVTVHGLLTEHGGANSLAPIALSKEEAQTLLDAEPGNDFNLSTHEIDSFKTLKKTLNRTPYRPIEDEVGQHYRKILFQRFKAYRRGGYPCDSTLCPGGEPVFKAFIGTSRGGTCKHHLGALLSSLVQGMARLSEKFAARSQRGVHLGGKKRGRPAGNHPQTPRQYGLERRGLSVDAGVLCTAFLQFQPMDNRLSTVS
jgi:hypothetical protein